jgi:hypothetical protein
MKYLRTCAAAAAALGVVAMTPASAEAGWRHGWWGGPGVGYVGPRYHYRHYSYRTVPIITTDTPTAMLRGGNTVTGTRIKEGDRGRSKTPHGAVLRQTTRGKSMGSASRRPFWFSLHSYTLRPRE